MSVLPHQTWVLEGGLCLRKKQRWLGSGFREALTRRCKGDKEEMG